LSRNNKDIRISDTFGYSIGARAFCVGILGYLATLCVGIIVRICHGEVLYVFGFPGIFLLGYLIRKVLAPLGEKILISDDSIERRVFRSGRKIRWQDVVSCKERTIVGSARTFAFGANPLSICKVFGENEECISFNSDIKGYKKLVDEIKKRVPANLWK